MKLGMNLILVLMFSGVLGCTTTGSYIPIKSLAAKPAACPIEVFMPGQKIDKNFEIVGTFSVQEMGLSVNCGWEEVAMVLYLKPMSSF